MWTYLQRWQAVNSLYHLQRKRDNVRWVQEHDLCAYIGGIDIVTHKGGDIALTNFRARVAYWFWGVRSHDELYRTIRNTIQDCEDKDVNWIARIYDKNAVSYYLNLTPRGREIYPYSHLLGKFFGNYYVKWIVTGLIVWILANHIITINL
jgi:hypothetical protein